MVKNDLTEKLIFLFLKRPFENFLYNAEMQENNKQDENEQCPLSNMSDIIQKIYDSLDDFKYIGNLFRVCKHTASVFPRITKIRIGEETCEKFRKLLRLNRSTIQEMEIVIQRPFCKNLQIPELNMDKLKYITIRNDDFLVSKMEKIFDINKLTNCNLIQNLDFIVTFGCICMYPRYIVHVEGKKIENLGFFSEEFDIYVDYMELEVRLTMKAQDSRIENLIIEDLVMNLTEPISVKSLTLKTITPALKYVGDFITRADKTLVTIYFIHPDFFNDEGCFVRVNILRLNRLLNRIDKKTLKEIHFTGFRAFDDDVLDLTSFENLMELNINLMLIKELVYDQIELEEQEEILYKEHGKTNHLTILLPSVTISIDLQKYLKILKIQ